MLLRRFILIAILFVLPFALQSQNLLEESLFTDKYTIGSDSKGVLALSIDNQSFFRNDEFDRNIVDGYTLPGFRLNPRLIFYPTSFVKLEAGLSLLKYWGTQKYPNVAYRGIADWKPDDYQWGFHLLPFFRAQIQPL